jgi:Ca2+-binding RTX toxin-like protein
VKTLFMAHKGAGGDPYRLPTPDLPSRPMNKGNPVSTAPRLRHLSRARRTARAVASVALSVAMVGGALFVPVAAAAAAPLPVSIGNPLIGRGNPTDTATSVFGVVSASPLPSGTLSNFQTWNQPGSAGNAFHAYVLRPTLVAHQYTVVLDSGLRTVPALPALSTGQVESFSVAPFAVRPGDLIGWYGQGIPLDIDPLGPDVIAFPGPATAPAAAGVITFGSTDFPVYPQARTYSIAATVTPAAVPVGQGFTVTASDLSFILDQIKIAEHHALTATPADPCAGLLGTGPNQVPSPLIALGLRTIDGSCNNLQPGQAQFGAADQTFPRLTTPDFRIAEAASGPFGPGSGPVTSYAQNKGSVFDSQPRLISNLIVDQTATNPSAIHAAGFPVRTQGNAGVFPCDTQGGPVGCTPAGQTLFIPNVTTDIGLSPPYNSLFTIFGQFFDHGLDKITNGGSGTVFVPLRADDPLIAGPDHILGNADDLPASLQFMVLTRGRQLPGPDGVVGDNPATLVDESLDDIHEATNTDSPWVDLSQAYTSHSSHQVFVREYAVVAGRPQSTGRLLSSADGSMANWGDVKAQAATLLGLALVDTDVANIPMIAADPYGNFIPGPHGLPQYVTSSVLVEGDLASPVPVPANGLRINTAFLNDIAHSAGPNGVPDLDLVAGTSLTPADCTGVTTPCYDNELLALHVIAGDGRVNENIGLTAIHTIFEHEHNRLVGYEQDVLNANPALLAAYQATSATTFTYGDRLFQAARFVTEMEYQHLVFEEFARKVQPAINPFNLFAFSSTATNPAIKAEFAHAVYRFGHSMLDETIPRINVDGSHNDIALLNGFLNPAAFKDVTPADLAAAGGDMGGAGAGAIVMGLSDQVGNELDEFVSDTLRNNLLGLPLDLASLNMARARSEGVPSLNNVRKQIFALTNDGQLTPYTDWVDFGLHIKHAESLINFVAAYGQHPTILFADAGPDLDFATVGDNAPATLASRRAAARAIVNPDALLGDVPPADAADFMFSTGPWANAPGNVSITGLDRVDLWVGGLAEITNPFGGLLGSTFNYVFELQLTQLQDDDRLYYLNRTPGMNLRTQLEGNSFAELIMRNTPANTLKADSFATADCKFQIGNLQSPAAPGSFITGAGSVNDDPASECNENRLLIKMASGQFKYRPVNSVDPIGINGQSVYNGSPNADLVGGGNDNDTIRGNGGNDVLEGNAGDDNTIGGDGNDIITDLGGDDTLKGGPGNDALDGGIGLDLLLGGDGKDLSVGGANTNVHFAGPGDDFILAGQGADEVDGDSGDDWMEGGDQTDLLQGDSGSLFFDDHNKPGNDIMIGQAGDDDYDMEGGDDIGVAGPGIEKNAGAAGYDWSIGLGDPQAQDADLSLALIGVPLPINSVRDRFNEVEALSGWNFNDTLRGDSVFPSQVGGGGFIGCDALDADGVARIAGLDALVPAAIRTIPSGPIVAASATNHCPLTGLVWGEGNILLGGAGSDTLEGRGANDILDGDRYLSVRLSVRTTETDPLTEIGSTDLLEHAAVTGTFGAGTSGMTLQQAVFAGLVDPGTIVAVREILNPGAGTNVDTALFSRPASNYSITRNADGSVTVADNAAVGVGDGIDTLWNMEQLSFCDVPGVVKGTCDLRAAPILTSSLTVTAPIAGTSPAALAFGNQTVATTSATQAITVSNTGTANLVVSGVTLTGVDAASFSIASTTCATLVINATCSINVAFAPASAGAKVASVSIAHNAAGSPSIVALTGTGVAPAPVAAVSPAALAFGSAVNGTTSASQAITVTNTGTASLIVSGVTLGGTDPTQFAIASNTCTVAVAPAATCAIGVTFTPTTAGAKSATVSIASNAAGSPASVSLAGTGIAPAPVAAVSPAALAFASQVIATVSATQTITLGNTGTANLVVSGVTLGGTDAASFTIASNTCTVAIAPAGTCTISVRFQPTTTGAKTAQVAIAHNAGGSPSLVPLSGTGVNASTTFSLPAGPIAFGTRTINSNTTKTVLVTNTGTNPLFITSASAPAPFANVTLSTCSAAVAVGKTCKLNVTFTPTAGTAYGATLTIVSSNATNSPRTVNLTGTGR